MDSNLIIGLLTVTVLSAWLYSQYRAVKTPEDKIGDAIRAWRQAALSLWREQVMNDERRMMGMAVAAASLAVSISIGISYPNIGGVAGWQLWPWGLSIFFLALIWLPSRNRPQFRLAEWKWPLLVTAAALLLRAWAVETVPGGLHIDEAGVADFAARHIFPPEGLSANPFHTGPASQPTLFHYMLRASFVVFGYSITGLRMTSVLAGTLAVLATYALIKELGDRRTAMIAAILMTGYHYHIHWSRIGLNNVWDTLWVPLMLLPFVWGWRKNWSGGALLTGLAVGLSQYFYAGARVGVFLLGFLIISLYRQNPDRGKIIVHVGKLVVTTIVVVFPLAVFAISTPEIFFERSQIVFGWKPIDVTTVLGEYDLWRYFWYQVRQNFGAFTSVPEVTGFYGPGVPYLIGLGAPLFAIGFFWALWKRHFVPVLWILLTILLGGMLLNGAPSSSHYAVSIPAIVWLVAMPISWMYARGYQGLAVAAVAIILATDLYFYFYIYIFTPPRDLIFPIPPWPYS